MNDLKNDKSLAQALAALAGVLTLFVAALTVQAVLKIIRGGVPPPARTIRVVGVGKETVVPDLATISLGYEAGKQSVGEAQKEVTKKINALTEALKKIGIDPLDVKTTQYTVYPNYNYDQRGQQKFINYRASQNLRVKIRNNDRIGDVLALIGDLELNQVGRLQFMTEEPETIRLQAANKALENARQKAQAYARTMNAALGNVVAIRETSTNALSYDLYDSLDSDYGASLAAAEPTPPFAESGTQEITAQVVATYELK